MPDLTDEGMEETARTPWVDELELLCHSLEEELVINKVERFLRLIHELSNISRGVHNKHWNAGESRRDALAVMSVPEGRRIAFYERCMAEISALVGRVLREHRAGLIYAVEQ